MIRNITAIVIFLSSLAAYLPQAVRVYESDPKSYNIYSLPYIALSLILLLTSAKLLSVKRDSSENRLTVPVILASLSIIIYRFWFILDPRFPAGLFWEEHEPAWEGRQAMSGGISQVILYTYTVLYAALSFIAGGISNHSLRAGATLLGLLSVLFVFLSSKKLYPSPVSVLMTFFFATSVSMTIASSIIEESFAMTILINSAMIYYVISLVKERNLSDAAILGIFCGAASMEYASVKPGILLSFFLIFSLAPFLRSNPRRDTYKQYFLRLIFFISAFIITSTPVITDHMRGGGAFFEGKARMQGMMGLDSSGENDRRLPLFQESFRNHLEALLLTEHNYPQVIYFDQTTHGIFSKWESGILCTALLLGLICLFRKKTYQSGKLNLFRFFFWTLWAVSLVAYCAFWNPHAVYSRRMHIVFLILSFGAFELFSLFYLNFPKSGRIILTALLLLTILHNSLFLNYALAGKELAQQFRTRTEELCAYMEKHKGGKYGIVWDWNNRVYLGDTPVEEWIEDTSQSGYDSWACLNKYDISVIKNLKRGDTESLSNLKIAPDINYIIMGTRYDNAWEYDCCPDVLMERIDNYNKTLGSYLTLTNCQTIQSSAFYLYRVCSLDTGAALKKHQSARF